MLNSHLVSAAVHGYLSWAPAASQCLRPSLAPPQQQESEACTGTWTGTGTGPGAGSPTGSEFSFPYQGLLIPGKLLGRRYLRQEKQSVVNEPVL